MNWNPKWLLAHGLRPMVPALITGAVILGCAHAPELGQIPALLSLDAESSVAEETPVPAPSVRHTVSPSPSAEIETLVQGTGNYPDGVYTGSAQGYGGTVTVQVTVENGQIVSIEILSASGETDSFFARAKGVIDKILTAQTWEVDGVSGATYSSGGIKGAVQNALTGEKVVNKTPEKVTGNSSALTKIDYTAPEGGYQDGTYTGSAQGFGGTITVSVTILEGKITDISVVSAPGETPSYFSSAKSVLSSMLSAQSPNVDTVSGATYSSTGIINAVKSALSQAAKGTEPSEEPSPSPTPTPPVVPDDAPNYGYLDGTYTGTGEGYGGDITVSVTVSGGQITAIEIVSAPEETPAYFSQATGVIEKILAHQVAGVDAVSGATFSSEGIMEAVENALSGAIAPSPSPSPSPEPSSEPVPSDSPLPSPSPSDTPTVTVETSAETYTGTATVVPDEDEDFAPYDITLTVTVTVTKTTTVSETETTIVTEKAVTAASVTADTDKSNLKYLGRAFDKMKDNLLALGSADAVSKATCSSLGIQDAWTAALSGVELSTVTETIPQS